MATKKKSKKDDTKPKPSASHVMLYVILSVYIAVALTGVIFIFLCCYGHSYEYIPNSFISLCSYAGICGSVTAGFYSTKASKENEIKLSNDKYRMRLEIAKEIFKEYGNSLDDKSVDLLQKLMSDKDVSEIAPVTDMPDWHSKLPQVDIIPLNNIENDEGVG